jgi:dTDP-glucose 4,6-dehydratase
LARSGYHLPVNCGNPQEMTIREFAERIAALMGVKLRIEPKPLPVDDPKVRQPDISLARELLDWSPVVGFDEGIRRTIGYFREAR